MTQDNYDSYSFVSGTYGDDRINDHVNSNVTIDAGSGDDSIRSLSDYSSISAGDGNDTITYMGTGTTINPGEGNDYVSLASGSYWGENTIQFTYGDGDDTIVGFKSNDTLQISDFPYYGTVQSGNDVIVNVGYAGGSIRIVDAPVNINVSGASYDSDYSSSYVYTPTTTTTVAPATTSSGGTITGNGFYSYISGTSGNDYIYPYGDSYSTIDAGAGNDTIYTYSDYLSISGGAGNDSIYAYSYDATINGGTGNDTIVIASQYATNNVVQYGYGDGNDVVMGFNDDDTLQITSGTYSTLVNGNDLVVQVGDGSIILADLAGSNVHIIGTYAQPTTTITNTNITDVDVTQNVTIVNNYFINKEGDTIINDNSTNYYDNSTNYYDNSQTTNITNNTTIVGITVNQDNRSLTINNSYSEQNFSLSNYTEYNNVINVDGSQLTGARELIGNTQSNSIRAGSGGSTMYGGGYGDNTMVGGSGQDWFQFSGDGNDVAQNFQSGRSNNSDVLYFSSSLSSLRRESSYLELNSDGSTFQVQNSSTVDEAIQYSTDGTNISYAKVGRANQANSFTYEDGVNFYAGSNSTDVLNVTNYQSRNIWLDGSAGVGYDNINNINASSSTGDNTLAGNATNNVITAGSGNDSMWGGSGGSADTLIGGAGQNMLFFGAGDGHDVMQNVGENDVVNLYSLNLEQITSVSTESNFIAINTADGSSLQVQNSSNLTNTFQLANGSAWKYNRSSGQWQEA